MRNIRIALFAGALAAFLPIAARAGISSPETVGRAAECLTKSPETAQVMKDIFGPTSFTGHFYGLKAVSVSVSGCSKVAPIADQGLLTVIGMAALSGDRHMLLEIVLTDGSHVFALQ